MFSAKSSINKRVVNSNTGSQTPSNHNQNHLAFTLPKPKDIRVTLIVDNDKDGQKLYFTNNPVQLNMRPDFK